MNARSNRRNLRPRQGFFCYMDYEKYLKSSHWKEKRKQKLRGGFKRTKRCYCCNQIQIGTIIHIHHVTYVRIGKEKNNDLQVLCEICHNRVHILNKKYGIQLSKCHSFLRRIYRSKEKLRQIDSEIQSSRSISRQNRWIEKRKEIIKFIIFFSDFIELPRKRFKK